MNGFADDLDSLLDDIDLNTFDEARRRPKGSVRTPSSRSSFQARQAPTAASQSQVQSAARTLDAKIDTLSASVKALETRTNTLAAEQDRTGALVKKEVIERRRSAAAIQGDLQQTKLMSVLLPMITTKTAEVEIDGKTTKVLTQSDNQFASLLPLLLVLTPPTPTTAGADAPKGLFSDPLTAILLISTLNQNK